MDTEEKKPNNKLKHQRGLRGWSQKKVALAIGTSKEMVSRWETGERDTSVYYQEQLCAVFGLTAVDLGFLEPLKQEETLSVTASQFQEVISMLSVAISQGIIVAVRELERVNMNTARRDFLSMLGTSLVLARLGDSVKPFIQSMLSNDQMGLFENEIFERWEVYHKGDTLQALDGLSLWLVEAEKLALSPTTDQQKMRTYSLVSISYQLQGSLFRDRMDYAQAHKSYQKAFIAAAEFDNSELKSSSLARRGVAFIQQQKPIDAIQYLESALSTIDNLDFPCLRGYIFQALSEAHAMAQHKDQCWNNIDLAEQVLTRRNSVIESSHCDLNTTSVTAQKGVNAVLLKDYSQALTLLDIGLN